MYSCIHWTQSLAMEAKYIKAKQGFTALNVLLYVHVSSFKP